MNMKLKDPASDHLFEAILHLESVEECYDFFEDLCSVSEFKAMSQRFEVAYLLAEGKSYQEIVDRTGASTATISRVKRSLNYGSDGYNRIFERIK
ncbi:MAG: helix-turn-helix domain-containing protein [Clostridia bacterium]|nr:helix-turn-helix domain-containing protein [Clostridia bacterium]